ncbi:MAG: ABC transporter substrate-binding protein [Pseudonocardiaceae bacterium]
MLVLALQGLGSTGQVTDGRKVFADNLEHVQKLIVAENDRVTNSGQEWVSIAVMLRLSPAEGEVNTEVGTLHQLQGAYLAQYWSNNPNGNGEFGTSRPLIKVIIADIGHNGQDWPDTVERLVDMADPESDERLVAVSGISHSTKSTQEAVDQLALHNIPMVGSTITATTLAAPGLFRVSPTNRDESAAMIEYLKGTEEWRSASAAEPLKAYLVQDRAGEDTYSDDLGKQYRQIFPNDNAHTLLAAQGDFDSSKSAAGNALAGQISTICAIRPKVVFFAGRSDGLRTLLSNLAARPCTDAPLTIVSGHEASSLSAPLPHDAHPLWVDDSANFRVLYTALASPQTWRNHPRSASPATVIRFGQCPHCFATLFPDSLADGSAIMAHDAVLTAVTAARNVTSPQTPRPVADALVNGLYQINATQPVPGASGWIYFQHEAGGTDVIPHYKAVPIMQLYPDGTATEIALSSRFGTPPVGPQLPR